MHVEGDAGRGVLVTLVGMEGWEGGRTVRGCGRGGRVGDVGHCAVGVVHLMGVVACDPKSSR